MRRAPYRILIIRPSALGDVSRTVAALVSLRRAWPNARIDWLVNEACAPAVSHHPMLDNVVTFARGRLACFGIKPSATREGLALARQLRHSGYDAAYDFQGLLRSGLLTWLTRATRRVGFADAREGAWLGYNVRLKVDGVRSHTVDRTLALLEADGLIPVRDMRLYLGDQDRHWLNRFEAEHRIGSQGYVCIAPTARWGCKCWPMDRYAEITRRLLAWEDIGRLQVVVLAAPDEGSQLSPLRGAFGGSADSPEAGRVIFPTSTVGQMMALVSRCRLLVCNDSAPLHVSIGFDRSVVAIFGPTDPAKVGPYGRSDSVVQPPDIDRDKLKAFNYRRHRHDAAVISQVSVDTVWRKITEQLSEL